MGDRNLEKICTESGKPEFMNNLVGTNYCWLRPSSVRIDCRYRCAVSDHNGLHPCMYDQMYDVNYMQEIRLQTKMIVDRILKNN